MKKFFTFLIIAATLPFACAQDAQQTKKTVLVQEKLVSQSQYLIVARGYPKPQLTNNTQIIESAKEAAVLNAQILAKERFISSFDVITNGQSEKFVTGEDYIDVYYTLNSPNIKRYLNKK